MEVAEIDISDLCDQGKLEETLNNGYKIINLKIGEDKMKDMRGIEIKTGDRVVYGKNCRHEPIKLGVVKKVESKSVYILGDGNKKIGQISDNWKGSKVLVLPKEYHLNKCDSCKLHQAECMTEAKEIKFGNGVGNDNVVECSGYISGADE